MKNDHAPLTPPDLGRCQTEQREGSFMTLGPRAWLRCENVPVVVAHECTPGPDGQRGSMSMCAECRTVFERLHPDSATFVPMEATRQGERT